MDEKRGPITDAENLKKAICIWAGREYGESFWDASWSIEGLAVFLASFINRNMDEEELKAIENFVIPEEDEE